MGGSCTVVTSFTLAEVLIVLGIIGLIADMTIPTLVQNTQEKINVVKLKKMHSTLENAFRMAVMENGTPDNWGIKGMSDPDGAENLLNILATQLKLTKNCGRQKGCWPSGGYLYLKGGVYEDYESSTRNARAILVDGSRILILVHNADCSANYGTSKALQNTCGEIKVDTNGDKGPNQWGVDHFFFWVTKDGIIPSGSQQETLYQFSEMCANKSTANGWACTAWVIYNENMDYLHCGDLSWDNKKKCN